MEYDVKDDQLDFIYLFKKTVLVELNHVVCWII